MMRSISFGQPFWFYGLVLVPILAALFWRCEHRREALLRKFAAARLLPRLAGNVSGARRHIRFLLLILAVVATVAALAQPRWGYTWEERKLHGRDILIAIDVSRSMLANDISPSRLARAKLAAEDLIGQLQGDRVGLIAFAGTAFLQAPLTADHAAVLDALREMGPNIIPRGGTDIAEALRTAAEAFGNGESDNRALVLFTDGEELEESAVAAAKEMKGKVRIFTAGIGSAEGSIIAIPSENGQTEYVKDPDGQIVKSRLDGPRLKEIAETTGGFYVHLVSGPPEMQQIFRDGLKPMIERDTTAQVTKRPIERYEWPLAAGMALVAASMLVSERKRPVLRAPALQLLLLLATAGFAMGKNPGIEAYEKEDFKGSLHSFEGQLQSHPDAPVIQFDLGSAAFKSGDLDRAMQAFSGAMISKDPVLRERAEYNLANTLAEHGFAQKTKPDKIQDLKNALQHYDSALKVQPKDADAQYNKDIVSKMLAELQKEVPKQEDKKQEEKKQQQNKKDKDEKKDENGKDKSEDKKDGRQDQKVKGDSGQQPKNEKSQQSDGKQKGSEDKDQPGEGSSSPQEGKPGEPGKPKQDGQQPKPEDGNPDGSPNPADQPPAGEPESAEQPKEHPSPQDRQPAKQPGQKGKEQGESPQSEAAPTPEEQAAEDAAAAAQGRMTDSQARQLLDSLKDEDSRVRLLNPTSRKPGSRAIRDW